MPIDLALWTDIIHEKPINPDTVKKAADITAQLLHLIKSGNYHITPSCCSLGFGDDEDFTHPSAYGTLLCKPQKEYPEGENVYKPLRYRNESDTPANEKSAVFVAGLITYMLVKNSAPDMGTAQQLKRSGSVLNATDTALDALMSSMTEADPEQRPDADGALRQLASLFRSEATVNIKEKFSEVVIGQENIPLSEPYTVWSCGEEERKFRGNRYFFEENKLTIPYRVAPVKYDAFVTFTSSAARRVYDNVSAERKKYGIDIGVRETRIVSLSGNVCKQVSVIPTCVEYPEYPGQRFFFLTTEADAFCFSDGRGHVKRISRIEAAADFARELMGKYKASDADPVFTYDLDYRLLFEKVTAAEKSLSEPVSPASAAGKAFVYENNYSGNMIFIDAGSSGTDIKTARKTSDGLKWTGECRCGGGRIINDRLYSEMIGYVETRYGIKLRDRTLSGLSEERYSYDTDTLEKIAEKIKISIKYNEHAGNGPENIYLYNEFGHKISVSIPYRDIAISECFRKYSDEVGSAVKNCLGTANLRENDVMTVVLTGRTALADCLADTVKKIFTADDCSVINLAYDTDICARGAALTAYEAGVSDAGDFSENLPDYGVLVQDPFGKKLLFKPLNDKDEGFENGYIGIEYRMTPEAEDIKNGNAVMKIYSREAGKSNVQSPYDQDGDAIRYIGRAEAELPGGYGNDGGFILFRIFINPFGDIKAIAEYYKKAGAGKKLLGLVNGRNKNEGQYTKAGDLKVTVKK